MLCRSASGELRFYMLHSSSWEPVGGAICIGEAAVPLIADTIVGAWITSSNGICVLFPNNTVAVTTVNDIFHNKPAAWILDAERVAVVGEKIREQHVLITEALAGDTAEKTQKGEYLPHFITVHNSQPPLSIKRFAGRPKFSIDRTGRPFRSKALPPSDEAGCIFALIACLWTMFSPPGIESSWSVDTTVLRLFGETRAGKIMAKWRGDGLPMASQLRRWLPFSKQLVLCTSYFERDWSDELVETFEGVHQKPQWIQSRGMDVAALMRGWLRDGKTASSLFDDCDVSNAFLSAHEWMCERRLHVRAQKRARRETSVEDMSKVASVVNHEIASLELLRIAVLDPSQGVPTNGVAERFDELAHGATAHVRNVQALTNLVLRVTELATQNRVISVQMDVVASELGKLSGNSGVGEYVREVISQSFQDISALTASDILSKARTMTQRQVDAVRMIADGVRMLGSS